MYTLILIVSALPSLLGCYVEVTTVFTVEVGKDVFLSHPFVDAVGEDTTWRWGMQRINSTEYDFVGSADVVHRTIRQMCNISYQFKNRILDCGPVLAIKNLRMEDAGCFRKEHQYGGVTHNDYFRLLVVRPKPVLVPIVLRGFDLGVHCQDALNSNFFSELIFSQESPADNLEVEQDEFNWYLNPDPKCPESFVNLTVTCCSLWGEGKRTCGPPAHIWLHSCSLSNHGRCSRRGSMTHRERQSTIANAMPEETCGVTQSAAKLITGCVGHPLTIRSHFTKGWASDSSWNAHFLVNTSYGRTIGVDGQCQESIYQHCNRDLTIKSAIPRDKGYYVSRTFKQTDVQEIAEIQERLAVNLQLIDLGKDHITLECVYNSQIPVTVRWQINGFLPSELGHSTYYNQSIIKIPRSCMSQKGDQKGDLIVRCLASNQYWSGSSSIFYLQGQQTPCSHPVAKSRSCLFFKEEAEMKGDKKKKRHSDAIFTHKYSNLLARNWLKRYM